MNEYLKIISPIVTFALGIWAVPFIETRKDKTKSKTTYANLSSELMDELEELPNRLKKMASSIIALQAMKDKTIEKGQLFKYVPRDTNCYFLKDAIEVSFGMFSKDQRYAIKSLLTQIDVLNSYSLCIKDTQVSQDTIDEQIKNCKRYVTTGCSMLNTIRIVAKHDLANIEVDSNITVTKILEELDIKLSLDDLKITGIIKFEG